MKMKRMVLFLGWLGLIFITLTSTSAFAEAEADSCGLPVIKKAFDNKFPVKVFNPELLKIQKRLNTRLNKLGYERRIGEEGYMGRDTRGSLQEFCRSQGITEKGDTLAATLIELLFKMPAPASDPKTPPDAPLPAPVFDRCPVPQENESDSAKSKDDSAVYYRLSAQDFTELEARDAILQQLETLKDVEYLTEVTLKAAVEEVLAEVTQLGSEYASTVLKTAKQFERYRLTQQSFDRLRLDNVPEAALEPLQKIKNLSYPDIRQLGEAVAFYLKSEIMPAAEDTPPKQTNNGNTGAKVPSTYSASIKNQAEQVTVYQLTDESFESFDKLIPAALSDDELEKLTDVAYSNQRLYTSAVCNALTTKDDPKPQPKVVQAVVDWARKTGEAKAPLEIHATDDCGCAREWDSIRENRFTVYGFYPFWMSAVDGASGQADGESQEKDAGAAVDFSVLSRIGYFALELDEKGNIADRRLWTAKDGAERFIKTARRYRSKVDLVIEVRHWHTWELPSKEDQKNSNLRQAVDSISSLLDPKSTRPSMLPDGVVLYFPDFPNHFGKTETDKISHLVTELRKKLNAGGQEKAPSLNILLDIGDLEGSQRIDDAGKFEDSKRTDPIPEQKLLAGLKGILVTDPAVDLMLVFLGQPVTEMKKRLRLAVENEFDGEERVSVLRKILPVIPPNGHRVETSEQGPYRQLQDDLVYFRDNFRGVAFWPVPTARDKDPEELRNRLVSTFAQSQAPGDGAQVLKTLVPDFCVYVCPNRLAYQIAFFVLLGLLILLALLASWSCRVRNALKKRFWHVLAGVAVLIAISVALITCDPVWNDQQLNILGGLVVFLIGSWLFHYIRKVKQGPLP
jgi:hypothetical protein